MKDSPKVETPPAPTVAVKATPKFPDVPPVDMDLMYMRIKLKVFKYQYEQRKRGIDIDNIHKLKMPKLERGPGQPISVTKDTKTYDEIEVVMKSDWPIHRLRRSDGKEIEVVMKSDWPIHRLRRSDGKRLKVSHGKFLRLKRAGVLRTKAQIEEFQAKKWLPDRHHLLTPPVGFFAIQTIGPEATWMTIMDIIDQTGENPDVLCYDHKNNCTMHMKSTDLWPKQAVVDSINYIKALKYDTQRTSDTYRRKYEKV